MRALPAAEPGTPEHRSAAGYLLWLAARTWPALTAAVLLAIVWMVCQALVPAVLGRAIDAGLAARNLDALLTWGAVLLGIGLVQTAAGIGRHRFAVFNWLSAAYRTVQVTVQQANRLGATLPRRLTTGEVVSIGTADIEHLGSAIDIVARATGAAVAVVVVTAILLSTSVPLGLVVLIGVPVLMAAVGLLIRPLHRRQQVYRDQQGRLASRAGDIVGGLRVLRGVGGEPVMAQRYRAESQSLRTAGLEVARVQASLEAVQILLPGAFVVLLTWLGARFALAGEITVGQLVSFYGYAVFLVAPLRNLTEAIDKFTRGHVAAGRVVALLSLEPDLTGSERAGPDTAGRVSAPAGPLVDPESGLVVRPCVLTAVAAADPADAVLLADRLGRYVDADVTLSGVPLRALPLATVRERILVADNDARLFSGPLRSQLDPHGGPPERIARALDAASAGDIVAALPDGLDGFVAERGREFSGGQQQRLRLARALLADPEILILVEPTSAVDAHTEARIADRLGGIRHGRTTVVCTSSPLLLARADHVVYVERGRVVAHGAHRELLSAVPRYAETVARGEEDT